MAGLAALILDRGVLQTNSLKLFVQPDEAVQNELIKMISNNHHKLKVNVGDSEWQD